MLYAEWQLIFHDITYTLSNLTLLLYHFVYLAILLILLFYIILVYDRGESKGSSCYRLQSRNGQFIFLRTSGFLEIDDQGIVESFVCVNSLVTESEGIQLISEMKKKYSAMINSALTNAREVGIKIFFVRLFFISNRQ